jgi:hypothetical protein
LFSSTGLLNTPFLHTKTLHILVWNILRGVRKKLIHNYELVKLFQNSEGFVLTVQNIYIGFVAGAKNYQKI